jgi:hypothetical protein
MRRAIGDRVEQVRKFPQGLKPTGFYWRYVARLSRALFKAGLKSCCTAKAERFQKRVYSYVARPKPCPFESGLQST